MNDLGWFAVAYTVGVAVAVMSRRCPMGAGELYEFIGGPYDGLSAAAKQDGPFEIRLDEWGGKYMTGVFVLHGRPTNALIWDQDWQPEEAK